MTGSAADRPLLQPHIYNKQTKKRLEKRFKDAKDDAQAGDCLRHVADRL